MTDFFRQRVVLAKAETVYGTDPVPTGAADAILCSEPTVTPLNANQQNRDLLYPTLGRSPDILVGKHVIVSFAVEMAGAGAAGTVPAYGALLRACGFAETVNALTDVQYDPATGGSDSVAIYFHAGGTRHALLGARGNVEARMPNNGVPNLLFTFTGLFVAPVAAAQPTADFSGFRDPLTVSNANTPDFNLHGFAAIMESFNANVGNAVVHRDRVNSESVLITGRQGAGSVSIESPAIGTKDYFAAAAGEPPTLGALQMIHGTAAGDIFEITAPAVQLSNPTYADSDGVMMLNMDLGFTRGPAGDDEIKFTVR